MKKLNFTQLLFFYLIAALLSIITFLIVESFHTSRGFAFFLTLLVSVITGIVFSFLYFSNISRRLEKISFFMEGLKKGDFNRSLIKAQDDNLGRLEMNLTGAAEELKRSFGGLEDELGQRESVLSSMGEAVVVIDNSGTIVLTNKKGRELFGGVLAGKKISLLSRDPMLLNLIEDARQKWTTVMGEISITEPKEVLLLLTVSPLIRNMKSHGSVILFRDITMIKKLENMRKDFVVNVSHELKTPLTSIRGFAETLIDGGIDDREHALRFLNIIKNNSERLSRLVEDLLTISNIETGKVKPEKKKVNVSSAIEAARTILEPKAVAKNLEIIISADESLKVMADRDRLEQILINLIDNGIKYTDKGRITVEAKSKERILEISVADTGSGVPKKDLSRLGERFYRVDSARSRDLGGTGLGLAIVKHLVTSMGGTLNIESEQEKGTTVSFTLPKG